MEPPVLFVMIVSLCLRSSLQDPVPMQKRDNKTNISSPLSQAGFVGHRVKTTNDTPVSSHAFTIHRTFVGHRVKTTNDTLVSSSSAPALRLHSNQTFWYLQGPISTKLIPTLYILILAVGVPVNLFTVCSLASKVRKVSSAILFCSLALSDLLLLLTLVFKAHYHLHGNHWVFGEAACRVVTACFYSNLYCSAQTLACISVSRYLAIVHPFTYRSLPKRKCTAGAAVVLWLFFGSTLVPDLLFRQSYWIPQLNIITCHNILPLYESHGFVLYYSLVLTVLGLLIPLIVSVVCYVRILNKLSQSPCDWGLYIRSSSLVFLIFLVCFTPAGVLHFFHSVLLLAGGTERLYMYFNVAVSLCCLHAAMDPFLFLFMSCSTGSNRYCRASIGNTFNTSASQSQ